MCYTLTAVIFHKLTHTHVYKYISIYIYTNIQILLYIYIYICDVYAIAGKKFHFFFLRIVSLCFIVVSYHTHIPTYLTLTYIYTCEHASLAFYLAQAVLYFIAIKLAFNSFSCNLCCSFYITYFIFAAVVSFCYCFFTFVVIRTKLCGLAVIQIAAIRFLIQANMYGHTYILRNIYVCTCA